jgi:hypothetical protein
MHGVVAARLAAAVVVTLIWCISAFAGFCDDLRAALSLSPNFASLRGAANGYNAWVSNITITGAQSCNILSDNDKYSHSRYSLYCSMNRLSSERDAASKFSALVLTIKKCAPQPKFSYRVKKTSSTLSFVFDRDNKVGGHLTVINVPRANSRVMSNTGQSVHDDYWLELAIIGK